jgi:hypothetical protein
MSANQKKFGENSSTKVYLSKKISYFYPYGFLFLFLLKKSSLVPCVLMH